MILACILLLAAVPAPAKGKKKGKGPEGGNAEDKAKIGAILDAQADKVQDCVMNNAIARGATEVAVTARVLINDRGELLNTQIDVSAGKVDGASTKECVTKILRTVSFPPPKSRAGLTDVKRTWKFATAPTGPR